METCGEVVEAIELYMGGTAKRRPSRPENYEVHPEDYEFARSPDYLRLRQNLRIAQRSGLPIPYFNVHEGITNDRPRSADKNTSISVATTTSVCRAIRL